MGEERDQGRDAENEAPPIRRVVDGRVPRADLIAGLAWLEERLHDRDNQNDAATLAFAAATVRDVLDFLGVSHNVLASLVGITDRKAVRQWVAGKATPRHGALMMMRMMLETLVEPPKEGEGTEARGVATAREALGPLLDLIRSRAELVGWEAGEIADAVQAWLMARDSSG